MAGDFPIQVDVSQAWDTRALGKVIGASARIIAISAHNVSIKSVTVTDNGKPAGGALGQLTKLGPLAGTNFLGWGFNATVEANGDINNCIVTQNIFELILVKNAAGKITDAVVRDATHKKATLINVADATALQKNWNTNPAYTPDQYAGSSSENFVLVRFNNFVFTDQSLEYFDFPGYAGNNVDPPSPLTASEYDVGTTVELLLAFQVIATGSDGKSITATFSASLDFRDAFLPFIGQLWLSTGYSPKPILPKTWNA